MLLHRWIVDPTVYGVVAEILVQVFKLNKKME